MVARDFVSGVDHSLSLEVSYMNMAAIGELRTFLQSIYVAERPLITQKNELSVVFINMKCMILS